MLRLTLFLLLCAFFAGGALFHPLLGVMGYMAQYMTGAERKWWHAPLSPLGLRYSFTFAVLTALGMALHWKQLRFRRLLCGQEKLALLMLALIWVLTLLTPEMVDRYTITDHPSTKMTKVIIFCLMMTHVVTRLKDLDRVLWLIVCGALILGLQAFELPRSAFSQGRLDGRVGGTDFIDANGLGIFMVAATIITSVMFMRSEWRGKLLCAAAGVFSVNTIILCRSRAAVLGLCAAALVVVLAAPKQKRFKLVAATIVAGAGFLSLSDPQFLERIAKIGSHAEAIVEGGEASDASVMQRIYVWRGARKMIVDHPLGVGPGRFNQNIGNYAPEVAGKSPHNTYFQAAAELGVVGLALFLLIVGNGLRITRNVMRESTLLPDEEAAAFQWTACSLGAVIVGYATYGVFGHLVYLECLWWYLLMPVCLQRAFENAQQDASESALFSQESKSPESEETLVASGY